MLVIDYMAMRLLVMVAVMRVRVMPMGAAVSMMGLVLPTSGRGRRAVVPSFDLHRDSWVCPESEDRPAKGALHRTSVSLSRSATPTTS